MKVLHPSGKEIDLGRIVSFGEPDWVDPESPEFAEHAKPGCTYQLKPVPPAVPDSFD